MKWAVGCRKGSELTLWFYEVEAPDAYCAEIEVGKHYPDLRVVQTFKLEELESEKEGV